jgi:hypothetical protein
MCGGGVCVHVVCFWVWSGCRSLPRRPPFLTVLEARAGLVAQMIDIFNERSVVGVKLGPGATPAALAPGSKVKRGPAWRWVLSSEPTVGGATRAF